jgi:hypothetical protein
VLDPDIGQSYRQVAMRGRDFFGYLSMLPGVVDTNSGRESTSSNAISGITIVGALVVAGGGHGWISWAFGFGAVVLAVMNVVGGYAVTDRMLQMFTKKPEAK